MKDDRKKEIIASFKDEIDKDDLSFDDLMSRKEKKRLKQQKKFEEKLLKELEHKKEKKRQKELEETKKIEREKIKQALKEEKGKNDINNDKLDKTSRLNKYPPKREISKFTRLFLSITAIGILAFWIFCIILSFNKVNHIYTLVCTSLISFGCLLLVLAGLITKSKPRSFSNIIGASCLLSFAIINGLVLTKVITFPTQPVLEDFTNKNVNIAMKWANENKVNLTPKYEYSDSIRENYVITQSERGEILARKIKDLEIIVSKGPNYELEANIPDMTGWHVDRVVKRLKELKLNLDKVNIEFNFNEEKRDTLYEQSKSGKMKRSDELTLKFSLGNEEDLKPVKLISLRNKDKFDALLWLKRNGIKYEIEYKFDDDIAKGKVINTDPKDGTMIEQSKITVKIFISKGAKIVAPDFNKMSLDDIIKWASENNISLNYESEFNPTIKAGDVIRVSANKGTIIEEGTTITVVTSKGALKMIAFGDDINKLRAFAEKNNIRLVEKQEFNKDIELGKIISVSHKPGQIINTGETIEVIISKGHSIKVPNFIGMGEATARKTCNDNDLDCTISYVYSSRAEGTVIDQNKAVGSEVSKNTNIVLSISKGEAPSHNDSGNNNGNFENNDGNNSDNESRPTQPPKPVCQTTTFYLLPEYIAINDPSKTCSNVKAAYSGYQVYCNYVSSNNGHMGQIISTSIPSGGLINSCTGITINIKNN